jgi:hypothetical protein
MDSEIGSASLLYRSCCRIRAKTYFSEQTIDQIGWTPYHWKLFVLTGFGLVLHVILSVFSA